MGFTGDPHRLLVSMTRAKMGLFIVVSSDRRPRRISCLETQTLTHALPSPPQGDSNFLSSNNKHWKAILAIIRKAGGFCRPGYAGQQIKKWYNDASEVEGWTHT